MRWQALESESTDPDAPEYESIWELMRVVDEYIPTPERETDLPFLMSIEDVFSIKGRGTVVTGRIDRGVVKPMEEVEIVGLAPTRTTTVTGVEMFRKLLDQGIAGDNVGCLLRGIGREDVERGQVLAKPGTITPHTEFMAQVYVLKKEEGGRHTPFFQGYRPQFYIRTMDITGVDRLAGRRGDGDAWRQREHEGGVDLAGGVGSGQPLRHPRRRSHRRRRRHHRDPEVSCRYAQGGRIRLERSPLCFGFEERAEWRSSEFGSN